MHAVVTAADPTPANRTEPSILVGAVGVFAVGLFLIVCLVRPWSRPLRVPYIPSGDALWMMNNIRGFDSGFWMTSNARVGAPFGQNLADFPTGGDNLNWAYLRVMSVFSNDPALLLNNFFILGFPMAATVAYVVLRRLGGTSTGSAVLALLFAFSPYHFIRSTPHVLLGAALAVPIIVALTLRIQRADVPIFRGDTWRPTLDRRAALWIAAILITSMSGAYYAVFAALLMTIAGVIAAIDHRSLRHLAVAAVVSVSTLAILAINNLPTLLYGRRFGLNPEVARRSPVDLDIYALRPAQLFTPVPGHRFGPLRELSNWMLDSFPQGSESTQFLGLVGAFGVIVALAALVVRRCGEHDRVARQSGAMIVSMVLIGAWGGLAGFLYWAGLDQLRGYNRLSPIVHMYAFVALLPVLDRAMAKIRRSPMFGGVGGRACAFGFGGLVLAAGLWDQIGVGLTPDSRPHEAVWTSERDAVSELERVLPDNSLVFQAPIVPYPEHPPVVSMADYDHFRPSVHALNTGWSYGGMKGRDTDWQYALLRLSVGERVEVVRAAGFDALWIDRFGYPDQSFERAVGEHVGDAPRVSPDGRYAWFDLRGLSRLPDGAALGIDALESPRLSFSGGTSPASTDGNQILRLIDDDVNVDVRDDTSVDAVIVFDLLAPSPTQISITNGDDVTVYDIGPEPVTIVERVQGEDPSLVIQPDVVSGPLPVTMVNEAIVDSCGPMAALVLGEMSACPSG